MCPSFMATRNEKDTTRARANILREMLTNSSKIVVDQQGGGNLLYLPLDKLMQMSGGDAALKPVQPEAVPPMPAPEASTRSRDAFRSRDREAR